MAQGLSPVPPQRQAPTAIPQDRPVYRIGAGKFFGPDDNLYIEGSILVWLEEPNQEMEPLNEMAREAMREYLQKLDVEGRKAADKIGKSYSNLADAYDNSIELSKQEGRKVQLLNGKDHVPLMGGKKKNVKAIETLDLSNVSEESVQEPKPRHSSGKKAVNEAVSDKGLA